MEIVDPTPKELSYIKKEFGLDNGTLKVVERQAKRPPVHIHESYIFTILLDIKCGKLKKLRFKGIYIFSDKDWLLDHSFSEG